MRIGGRLERDIFQRTERRPWLPIDLGMVVVSCERGDMRHSQHGVAIYDDEGLHDMDLTSGVSGNPAGQRRAELEELHSALALGKPVFHDGRWGMATLEVCLAMMESARERREVQLNHQVAVSPHYDADLDLKL